MYVIIYNIEILLLYLGSNNFEEPHTCSLNNNLPIRSLPGYGYSTKIPDNYECEYAIILNDHVENEVWKFESKSRYTSTKNDKPIAAFRYDSYNISRKLAKNAKPPFKWTNFLFRLMMIYILMVENRNSILIFL